MIALKSTGAVLAGLVFIFSTHMGIDHFMHTIGVFPPYGEPMTDSGQYLIALSYRIVFTVIGCFITAWLAPCRPMLHALVLGGIGVVLATTGMIVMWGVGPVWYPIALILVTLPCAWMGGRMYRPRTPGMVN